MIIVVAERVAVAEKTLEHWVSQYIAYRFNKKAALWWPTRGEDVNLDLFPAQPGKAIQLELKTATPSGPYQDVKVDLGQLWEYRQRPLGEQPFYAFPRPHWEGNLVEYTRQNRKVPTELGVSRSGDGWWFVKWMVVLTTAQICEVLAGPLRNHGSSSRRPARLVRFEPAGGAARWGADGSAPPATPRGWLSFWDRLLGCGEPDWPQLVRLPGNVIGDDHYIRHDQLIGLLRRSLLPAFSGRGLVTFAPDGAGGYEIYSAAEASTFADAETEAARVVPDERRVTIFLDAAGLG